MMFVSNPFSCVNVSHFEIDNIPFNFMTKLSFQCSDIKSVMTKGHSEQHAIPQFLMTIAK